MNLAVANIDVAQTTPWVLRLDPRTRVVTAVIFACCVVSLSSLSALGLALMFAFLLLFATRQPPIQTLKKVMTMDGFILFMLCMLPFTTPGTLWFEIGPLTATWEGFIKAVEITLKANAIVMTLLALVGTIEPIVLGHALSRLRVPENLVHLMLFSVRYIDVLKEEYFRLRTAMKARCFTPHNSMHTYRSIGYLLGMMLVRSLERSERILEAMKCRGFHGKFYLLGDFHFQRRDRLFCVAALSIFIILIWTDFYYG